MPFEGSVSVTFTPQRDAEVSLKTDAKESGAATFEDEVPALQVSFDEETVFVPLSQEKKEELEEVIMNE